MDGCRFALWAGGPIIQPSHLNQVTFSNEAGCAEHLTKPTNFGQLEAAIARVAAG